MKGGKYIPPNRKRLADDLLDKAEARETESLKDVLIRLARQKKSGSIVLDGRKSISKLPMVNFLFHCADGTWLLECVDTSDWRSEMEDDETKGDWIFEKVVEHIDALNKMAGAEVVDQVITDSAGDCKKARRQTLVALQCSNTISCCRSGYQRRTCTLTRPSSAVTRRRPTSSRLQPFGLTRRSKWTRMSGGTIGVRGRRCCTTSPLVSRASRSPSAQRSDVGKHVPTSIAPNENDLALREQQSSLACATTCGSGRRGRIRPLSRCVYHR